MTETKRLAEMGREKEWNSKRKIEDLIKAKYRIYMRKIERKNTYAHRERERSLEDSKKSTSKKSQRGEERDKQRDTQGDKKDLCNNTYNE